VKLLHGLRLRDQKYCKVCRFEKVGIPTVVEVLFIRIVLVVVVVVVVVVVKAPREGGSTPTPPTLIFAYPATVQNRECCTLGVPLLLVTTYVIFGTGRVPRGSS